MRLTWKKILIALIAAALFFYVVLPLIEFLSRA